MTNWIDLLDVMRFKLNYIQKSENDCWLWLGAPDTSGYGMFRYKGKLWKAHRFAYYIEHGVIHDNVLHKCDIRRCVNPKCLFLGTKKDNAEDRDAKGRGCLPYQIGKQANAVNKNRDDGIKYWYNTGDYSIRSLARELGVSYGSIYNALNR